MEPLPAQRAPPGPARLPRQPAFTTKLTSNSVSQIDRVEDRRADGQALRFEGGRRVQLHRPTRQQLASEFNTNPSCVRLTAVRFQIVAY